MKTNRWLKALALAMSVLMIMTAIAIPTFADETDPFAGYDKWDGTDFAEEFWAQYDAAADGAGKEPIIIDTAAKLAGLAKKVNDAQIAGSTGAFKNQQIYVTANIDLQNMPFPSIGRDLSTANFAGLFEGRLNNEEGVPPTIANALVIGESKNNFGFIANLRGGAAKCFTMVNATVGNKNNSGAQGIAIGYASKVCEISDITVINSKLICTRNGGTVSSGGVLGTIKADNDQVIKNLKAINVTFEVPSATGTFLGGVVCWIEGKGNVTYTLEDCYFSGKAVNGTANMAGNDIYADTYFGGIVGEVRANPDAPVVTLKNCQFNGEMISALPNDSRIGQFGAFIGNASVGTITLENCLNSGKIASYQECVGMIGEVGAGVASYTATNCYSVVANTVAATVGTASATFTATTPAAITGDAAKTVLAGFDFTETWTANAGALPTLAGVVDATWTDPATAGEAPIVENTLPDVDTGDTGNTDKEETTTTKAPEQTTTTAAPAPAKKKGCFGVISSTAMVALLTVGLGVTVIRKKED